LREREREREEREKGNIKCKKQWWSRGE
jgi:hypothetical protein